MTPPSPTLRYEATHSASTMGTSRTFERPSRRAYGVLYWAFVALPIVAGADKFFGLLTDWERYLAPWIARLSPVGADGLMVLVGVVEVLAGVLVAFRPRLGAQVVCGWLWAIVINLLTFPGHFDIALRDLGLSLGALALAHLSDEYSLS